MNILKATIIISKSELYERSLKEILESHGLNVPADRILELKSNNGEVAIKIE